MRFDDWGGFRDYFPPSKPKRVEGGIKASTRSGKFGESWWARRWIEVLESFDIGSRLDRGRSYARKGQVLSIDIKKGLVEAKVQGSQPRPYQVTIKIRPLMAEEWRRLADQLSKEAIFAAKLLAGEMPHEIEQVFTKAKLSLFPEKLKEISTACSCPDWSNPCKHIAAVYYLLGEAFDRDPFLIFRLRGMDRDEFRALLGQNRTSLTMFAAPLPKAVPLTPRDFWSAKTLPEDLLGNFTQSRSLAGLPLRLGNLQFWRGEMPLPKALEPIYEGASRKAEQVLLEEKPNE